MIRATRGTIVVGVVTLSVVAGIALGCTDASAPPDRSREPFAFPEVRQLARLIAKSGIGQGAVPVGQFRRISPRVAQQYRDALVRFDGTYGAGVGPAKRTSGYLDCKAAFSRVAEAIDGVPVADGDAAQRRLWARLQACRGMGQRLSGPVEIATFGNDLKMMSEGAMLVLSFAITASGSRLGPKFYSELAGTGGAN
ncbi:hypothetical protein [Sphingomonas sp. VNH70]|uniref:hypothetical protein n=1 Tax=Sphingomonas silueang TaxID=3156617 RepID=UPI0032B34C93